MSEQYIKITNHGKTEQFPDAERQALTDRYRQAADEGLDSECERCAYIASSLSLGAVAVDADYFISDFPEGTEGAALESQFQADIEDLAL